jgi:hypothetical protein
MYDIHPHERLCMRELLGNELPFPWNCVFPNPYFGFSLFNQPFVAFDFHLLSPFLGMHLLHGTWGDGLLARGQSLCFLILSLFLTLLFFLFCFSLHFKFSNCSFDIIFLYQVASTSSILAPPSRGIMRHEPLWLTYDNQPKRRDNRDGKDGACYAWIIGIWTRYPYQGPRVLQLCPRVTTLD